MAQEHFYSTVDTKMAWLYRLSGGILLFHMISTCLYGASMKGGGGVSQHPVKSIRILATITVKITPFFFSYAGKMLPRAGTQAFGVCGNKMTECDFKCLDMARQGGKQVVTEKNSSISATVTLSCTK